MKLFSSFVCLVMCAVISPAVTVAQEAPGYYVFGQIAAPEYSSSSNLSSDGLYGVGAGYRFEGPVAVEVDYLTGDTSPKAGRGDADVTSFSLRALYHFLETDRINPYVSLGFGQQEVEFGGADKEEHVDLGLGLRWQIWNNLDGRASFNFYDGNEFAHLKRTFNVALLYRFNSSKAAKTAARPADSDGDGVVDSQDRCLGTPAGVSVDAQGCQVQRDTDGDGVADASDRCPGTTDASREVDQNGCYVQRTVMVSDDMEATFLFDFDSAEVKEEHKALAREIARFVRGGQRTKVRLTGHTDSTGTGAYNQALSERRSARIKDLLVEAAGIPANQISTQGFGSVRPAANNATRESRRLNRRVEVHVETTRATAR
jgi:OOP family OmpA-OmpF porin